MKYLLLIYGDAAEDALNDEVSADWDVFNEHLRERGAWCGAEALRPASTARTVQFRDGKPLVTDGPFAETKEQLAGYYLVDCGSEAEALELAARIPSAAAGEASIEVRAIWDFSAGS